MSSRDCDHTWLWVWLFIIAMSGGCDGAKTSRMANEIYDLKKQVKALEEKTRLPE